MTMFPKRISSGLTASVLLLVVGLGAWMWVLQPEHGLKWAVAMFMLPAAWGGLRLLKKAGACRGATETDQRRLRSALMGAGLILAVSLSGALANTLELVDAAVPERAMGVTFGAVLMIIGNSIPKNLPPLSEAACAPSREQSLQRFAGWIFVLTGLVYSIVWMVLAVETAKTAATMICAAGVLLVIARVAPTVLGRKGARSSVES